MLKVTVFAGNSRYQKDMEKKIFEIKGMSCAACAARIERSVKKLSGVHDVNVMLLKNRMSLLCDPALIGDQDIIKAVTDAGYSASISSKSSEIRRSSDAEARRQKIQLVASFGFLVLLILVAMGPMFGLIVIDDVFYAGVLQLFLALVVMILQRKYYISACRGLAHGSFNMDSLVSLGSLVCFAFSIYGLLSVHEGYKFSMGQGVPLYFDTTAAILTFVAIGKYFEERTKVRTSDAVMMLYDLAPKFVTRKDSNGEYQIPLADVRVNDILVIKAGDQIGVDGIVTAGSGFCDESSITGESRPVKKTVNSKIISSTVLTQGALEIRAQAVGAETTLSKIIALVDDVTSRKAPIARIADFIAGIFVPVVIFIAALTFVFWYFLLDADLRDALNFAVSVLVVSCPCALGLATPLAIVAGTGRAAKAGILFKSPEVVETLRKASVFVFDKTGTLTSGNMTVTSVNYRQGADQDEVLAVAASLERKSNHPLALAVLRKFCDAKIMEVSDFVLREGEGIEGIVNGKRCGIGNRRMVTVEKVAFEQELDTLASVHEGAGSSVLYVIYDDAVQAILTVSDELKPSSKATVAALKNMGIHTLMLTGDTEKVAHAVAEELGIESYRAGLYPKDKADIISSLQQQGHSVVMIGDGINDSVALATADIGIGLAGTSDIAVSSCDVVLLRGNLIDAVSAAKLSRSTMTIIKQNLFWAFIYNIIFIPVAAGAFSSFGWYMTPIAGAVMMSLSSVCVGLNALRLTGIKIEEISDKIEEKMNHKVISVDGMSCKHCVKAVTNALQALDGVTSVDVSLERKSAEVSFEGEITDDVLKKAITDAGYEVRGIHS